VPLALLYHAAIEVSDPVTAPMRALTVAPRELDWQFGELRRFGYRSSTLDEFHEALTRGGAAVDDLVLITFDDGYAHVFEAVSPLLERHGMTATMFVPYAHIGATNDWDTHLPVADLPLADLEQLDAAVQSGLWELGSHALRHEDLRALEPAACLESLAAARRGLSTLTGTDVVDLAYPYGFFDGGVVSSARDAGYRMAFAAGACDAGNLLAVPRRLIRGQESRQTFKVKIDREVGHLFG
jgi:peptidoglycan/xylan/chitin deacetylase (PgdA/CDA1 family)